MCIWRRFGTGKQISRRKESKFLGGPGGYGHGADFPVCLFLPVMLGGRGNDGRSMGGIL
jgi:hypothetical protein